MNKRLTLSSILVLCSILIGCFSSERLPQNVTLNGISGELYSLPGDRYYLIFDEVPPHLDHMFLKIVGYKHLAPQDRPPPTYSNYPGSFGVGIDRRENSRVYHKESVHMIFADNRWTAEIIGINPNENLEELARHKDIGNR